MNKKAKERKLQRVKAHLAGEGERTPMGGLAPSIRRRMDQAMRRSRKGRQGLEPTLVLVDEVHAHRPQRTRRALATDVGADYLFEKATHDLGELMDKWQDEAAEAALAGNPQKAAYIEHMAMRAIELAREEHAA